MSRYLLDGVVDVDRKGRYRALFCCCIIAGMTFIAFSPSLKNGFTNWDDDVYVVDNPDIKGCTLRHMAKVFSSVYVSNYQPLTMLTYMAEHHFFQLNPFVYHCTNLLLHSINSLLVFALIYGLSGKYFTGLLVGLLFAVHPLRVESVAWIAERKDMLSAFFYYLSLLFYLRYMKTGGRKSYGFCLLSLLLSLLSKPMAVSQPFVLLFIDYLNGRKIDKKTLLDKVPFFAIAGTFAVITLFTQQGAGSISDYSSISILQRICVPFYGILFYLVKSVLPVHLCAYYSFPAGPDHSMNLKLLISPFLVIGGAAVIYCFAVKAHRGSPRLSSEHRVSVMGTPESEAIFGDPRKIVFGSLFFLVTALPVLQIVPVGNTIVAERYTYVPLLGIYFIFAELCGFLLKVKFKDSNAMKGVLLAGLGISIVLITCMTRERCGVWNNSLSLWSDVIRKFPVALAYNNRGLAYRTGGDNDRAIQDYTQAIMLNPGYAQAYDNRGLAYKSKGGNDWAIHDYTQAITLNPRYAMAYSNRGAAYYAKGDYDRAIHDYTQAITLDPGYARAYYNRGLACHAKGDDGHVRDDIKKACDLGLAIACKLLDGQPK